MSNWMGCPAGGYDWRSLSSNSRPVQTDWLRVDPYNQLINQKIARMRGDLFPLKIGLGAGNGSCHNPWPRPTSLSHFSLDPHRTPHNPSRSIQSSPRLDRETSTMRAISTILGFLSASAVYADATTRQCFIGEPPLCNNSLLYDPTCRGLNVSTPDAWKRMDCDYVVYNIPTTTRETKKWIVIHAAGCDTWTGALGDYFAPDMELNLFGLRPCGGYEDSLCNANADFDLCTALHISWYFPAIHPTVAPYGTGFNPPGLVDIYHTPGTTMIFLHEYGDSNTDYNWFGSDGCNATSKPMYMCLAGLDPDYDNKFKVIKPLLEQAFTNTPSFPCILEVIDANQYAQDASADIPCTGILREYNDPAKVRGDTSGAPNWAWEMTGFTTRAIQLASEVDPQGELISAFRTAINIALCKQFDDPNQTVCLDDDMVTTQAM
jgi:hypothetical protein